MTGIQKSLLRGLLGLAAVTAVVAGQQAPPAGQAPAGQRGGGARGGGAGGAAPAAAPAGQGGQAGQAGQAGQRGGAAAPAAGQRGGQGAAAAAPPPSGVTVAGEVPNYVRVTDAMLQKPPDADWLMLRRDQYASSYSPLNQITAPTPASCNWHGCWP